MRTHSDSASTPRSRVLLVGIDGVRFDSLLAANTPHLDALIENGFLRSAPIPRVNPTWSGPMWATILTGVWADQHGVKSNYRRSDLMEQYPDFLTQHANRDADAEVFAVVDWGPIARAEGCGPILHTVAAMIDSGGLALEDRHRDDGGVTDRVVEILKRPELTAGFAYLAHVDEVGHEHGVGPDYMAAIEGADARLGQMLTALDARADRDEWTVLVTTDHGHRAKGGHGRRSKAEATVWFASDTRPEGWESLDSAGVAPFLLNVLSARRSVQMSARRSVG